MKKLDVNCLAELFGTNADHLNRTSSALIEATDLRFSIIEGAERDKLILSALKKIHSPEFKSAGGHRKADWEHGWHENLLEFMQSGYDTDKLIPKYYKKNVPIRLNRQYVLPVQPDFVYKFTQIFRSWIFQEYLHEYESIYEFGCGTAYNLVHLAALYPDKRLYGFDWAKSSQEIIRVIADRLKLNIQGGNFDFFNPDETINFEPGSAVFTFGALEQVGANHGQYLDFIIKRKSAICIDIVGLHELYDEVHLLDYLAWLYHQKRNYLQGYLSRLKELEAAGIIEIVKIHHQLFGNLYDDPHSYVIWKPQNTLPGS